MKPDNLTVLKEFLHKYKNIDLPQMTPETSLEELKIDSLMVLELMFEFEDRFGIKVPNDIPTPMTVGDLLSIVDGANAGKSA